VSRRGALTAALTMGAVALLGCGDDDGVDVEAFDGQYEVAMVVGAARSDDSVQAAALPATGTSFTEQWVLTCNATTCVLRRPEGGALLGDLDGLELALPPDDAGGEPAESLTGRAVGVHPEPAVDEPDPCDVTPAHTWTVRVDVSLVGDVLHGSVIRIPDELLSSVPEMDCYGVDLTLGLSGVRR